MYCNNCGKELLKGYKFCPRCGNSFSEDNLVANALKCEASCQTKSMLPINSNNDIVGQTHRSENEKLEIEDGMNNAKDTIGQVLIILSVFCIIAYSYLLFTNNSKDTAYFPIICGVMAMANPLYSLYFVIKRKNESNLDLAIGSGIVIYILGCIVSIIVGLVFSEYTLEEDWIKFIIDFLKVLLSTPYQYAFLVLIIIANATTKWNNLCLFVSSFLLGLLTPFLLAAICFLVVLALALLCLCLDQDKENNR